MPKTSNGCKYQQFITGMIIGVCGSMMLVLLLHHHDPSNMSLDSLDIQSPISITNTDNTVHSKSSVSIFDRMQSPSNRLPPKLDQTSEAAKQLKAKRHSYGGGDIDPEHLGGFWQNDSNSYERQMWEWAIDKFNVTSVLDVGCGKGYSSLFFKKHESIERILCVEGSTDAVQQSLLEPQEIVQHDYTLGPYWPPQSYDMVWCIEFLEHIDEKYMAYYMATFKKAKMLFVTASNHGGWHHVNVKRSEYWIEVFHSYGFVYLPNITSEARVNCPGYAHQLKYSYHDLTEKGNRKNVYFYFTGLVFLNPLFLDIPLPRNVTLFDEMLLSHIH